MKAKLKIYLTNQVLELIINQGNQNDTLIFP
jgi:hypothetical protein